MVVGITVGVCSDVGRGRRLLEDGGGRDGEMGRHCTESSVYSEHPGQAHHHKLETIVRRHLVVMMAQ